MKKWRWQPIWLSADIQHHFFCQKGPRTFFTQSSVHVLLHKNKSSHNLFVKKRKKKKSPFFPFFSTSHRINKTVNSSTKLCLLLDQLEHHSAFPIFVLVSSGFAQIIVVIFPWLPVKVPMFCLQGGNKLLSSQWW